MNAGARSNNPPRLRQQQGHKRVHVDQSAAQSDLHRGQGPAQESRPGDGAAGGLRGPPDHAAVARWLAASSGQRAHGHPKGAVRPTRPECLAASEKVRLCEHKRTPKRTTHFFLSLSSSISILYTILTAPPKLRRSLSPNVFQFQPYYISCRILLFC